MVRASEPAKLRRGGRELAALISSRADAGAIANVLAGQQLEVEVFDAAQALLTRARPRPPALIVLCSELASASSRALVAEIVRVAPDAPVVVLCASIRQRALYAALAAGAAGIVLRDEMPRALGPCLQAVRAGQVCVPRHSWQAAEPLVLSSREKQVLGLVVMGYMNSQIARQLFVAESTVKSHLSSAFVKLGVRSRNEAVARILDPQAGLGVGILGLCGEPLQGVLEEVR